MQDDVFELEQNLLRHLGVQFQGLARLEPPVPAGANCELLQLTSKLRESCAELCRITASVGSIPVGYPWHLNLIMRAISALLPWYTRPIRESVAKTAECMVLMAEVLTTIAERLPTTVDSQRGDSEGLKGV